MIALDLQWLLYCLLLLLVTVELAVMLFEESKHKIEWRDSIMEINYYIQFILRRLVPAAARSPGQRDPRPALADSEVLTIEVVIVFLGIKTDKGTFKYFRRHWDYYFPKLAQIYRTTFVRQSYNL